MNRQIRLRLRWVLLLWALGFAVGLVPHANIAYDGLTQSTVGYDAPSLSAFGYDVAPALAGNEKEGRGAETSGIFARIAKFLAAKTAPEFLLDSNVVIGRGKHQ